MRQLEVKSFTARIFTEISNGKSDVVVTVDGKELYRQPKTRETYFAGFDIYVQHKFGIPLSEYEKRFNRVST